MNEDELSRLKEFRQLKKQIQGSERHLIVGIDVAKDRHHAFVGTATGRTLVKKLIFANTSVGFAELLARVEGYERRAVCRKSSLAWNPRAITINPWGGT